MGLFEGLVHLFVCGACHRWTPLGKAIVLVEGLGLACRRAWGGYRGVCKAAGDHLAEFVYLVLGGAMLLHAVLLKQLIPSHPELR